ncbi:LuxR family transcriptional regulator [Rhodotorula toruloides]|nr:LuxR family transcriptional regulator [Rhodotorula toruloides]
MRLIHLVWGSTKQDYRSLNGLRLRQSVKAIWGFDPAEPDDPGDEANEKACPASLAQELEEMTGMPAENLLDYLETLGHMFDGKRSFDTMCAWMRRGMDLDDPQLAEVFADDIMAYTLVQQHLWPACDKPAAQAAPAQSKKTKKPKSGAAKLAQ